MKYLKSFNESLGAASREYIEELCKKYISGSTCIINEDGTVDVIGDVDLGHHRFNRGELPIKFNKVYGDFSCVSSNLKTLQGCPKYVSGSFSVKNNDLETLKYIPDYIGDYLDISHNRLKLIDYLPKSLGFSYKEETPDIYLNYNQLTNFIKTKFNVVSYDENPISDLITHIVEQIFYPIEDDLSGEDYTFKNKFNEIKDRFEEFEIIKENKLDLISLNSLYDYYEFTFDENQFKNFKGYEIY